jgi:S1-C subfamily serine protease
MMQRFLGALLGLVLLAAPSIVRAQNNAQAQNSEGAEVVGQLLDAQHRHRGFSRDPSIEDWSGPLLRSRDRIDHTVELQEGVTYRIVAVCDLHCGDVDLEAFDSDAIRVDRDVELNDTPQLNITPLRTGNFTIRTWWAHCNERPCYVATRVLRQNPGGANRPAFENVASGTGFLIAATGLIVTNHHVINNATTITVQANGENVTATVVASDPVNDIALIRANVAGTPLALGTASGALRGQDVMTLGYPLVEIQGEGQKAAFGRINALTGLADDVRYMQIDVPVQPGNSGGPLLNQQGAVIGIVSATVDQATVLRASGTLAQNVNYAIKSDYILPLIPLEERPTQVGARPVQTFADVAAAAELSVFRIVVE